MVRGTWRASDVGTITFANYLADYLASRLDLAPCTRALYERLSRVWLCTSLEYPPAPGRAARTVDLGAMQIRTLSVTTIREWHAAAIHTAAVNAADRAARADRYQREHAAHAAARAWARQHGYTA